MKHDYDSAGTGGNRFATILLYMSDLGENDGGETVFPYGEPTHIPEEERITQKEVRNKTGSPNDYALRTVEERDLLISFQFFPYPVVSHNRL